MSAADDSTIAGRLKVREDRNRPGLEPLVNEAPPDGPQPQCNIATAAHIPTVDCSTHSVLPAPAASGADATIAAGVHGLEPDPKKPRSTAESTPETHGAFANDAANACKSAAFLLSLQSPKPPPLTPANKHIRFLSDGTPTDARTGESIVALCSAAAPATPANDSNMTTAQQNATADSGDSDDGIDASKQLSFDDAFTASFGVDTFHTAPTPDTPQPQHSHQHQQQQHDSFDTKSEPVTEWWLLPYGQSIPDIPTREQQPEIVISAEPADTDWWETNSYVIALPSTNAASISMAQQQTESVSTAADRLFSQPPPAMHSSTAAARSTCGIRTALAPGQAAPAPPPLHAPLGDIATPMPASMQMQADANPTVRALCAHTAGSVASLAPRDAFSQASTQWWGSEAPAHPAASTHDPMLKAAVAAESTKQAAASKAAKLVPKREVTADFQGTDEPAKAKQQELAARFIGLLTPAMQADVRANGKATILDQATRMARLNSKLPQEPVGTLYGMCRFMGNYIEFCTEHDVSSYPPYDDAVLEFLECYKDQAHERGQKQLDAQGTGQGGITAVGSVRLGGQHCHEIAGLAFEVCSSAAARTICHYGTHMPKVQPMMPLQAFGAYEHVMINADGSFNAQQAAWAAANWLKMAGSPRPIDTQRVSTLAFRNYAVLDSELPVASAVTRKSKGRNRWVMRALEWRAVLIPIYHDEIDWDACLAPLVSSMASMPRDQSCLFRMYSTPGDKQGIQHANGWLDRAATSSEMLAGEKELLSGVLTQAQLSELTGYWTRHVMPEIGRGIRLPHQARVSLGYWRDPPVVNSVQDDAAVAAAVRVARARKNKASRIALNANRYSSVHGEPLEQDQSRTACMLAIKAAVRFWKEQAIAQGSSTVPLSQDDQLRVVAEMHSRSIARLDNSRSVDPSPKKVLSKQKAD